MLQDIWTPDVKTNQLADVISGVSPIRSMVNVGSGVADLILLPIEQYRKDGRLARGLQRGGNSFVQSTAMEMMKLGARLATGTQVVLERAEGVLGSKAGEPVILEATGYDDEDVDHRALALAGPSRSREDKSRYANQPTNVREGLRGAYSSLSSNFNSAAQTILAVPMEVYERSGEDVSKWHHKWLMLKLTSTGPAQGCGPRRPHRRPQAYDRRLRGCQQDALGPA
jgi:autophagy-related protein 2